MTIKISEMNQTHLDEFIRCANESYGEERWTGYGVAEFLEKILSKIDCKSTYKSLSKLRRAVSKLAPPNGELKRNYLKKICKNSDSDLLCFLSVMAWGCGNGRCGECGKGCHNGRMVGNAIQLFNHHHSVKNVLHIIKKLRKDEITHLCAYKKFNTAHREKNEEKRIKHLGPAFYTKLIFFCDPKHRGYIMDRWTANSINLLLKNKLISTDKSGYVTKYNKKRVYECFCGTINELATHPDLRKLPKNKKWLGEDIELILFSSGKWREHVRTKYKHAKLPEANTCTCENKK